LKPPKLTAAPPIINYTDDHGRPVSEQQVQSCHLNGAVYQNLVMLQPGMAQDTGSMGWLSPQWNQQWQPWGDGVATLDGSELPIQEMGTGSSGTLT